MIINCFLLFLLIGIGFGDDSSYFVETIETQHVDIQGKTPHKHNVSAELNSQSRTSGCPDSHNVFSPCSCYEVSFDGKTYQNMISCRGLDGKQIQSAFHNAAHEISTHHLNTTFDILEIKDANSLNLNVDDLTKGFKFRTIKITDSSITNINENSFESTAPFTKEFVLMDIAFENGLDDGKQLFNTIKKFENLEGIYIITSNLKEVPQNAFIANGKFGENLQIIRICNSLISRLYDLTFANLSNLLWIDLGDNRIDQISANTFTMVNSNSEVTLRISLRHNRLTSDSIEAGAFADVKRAIDIYLTDNKISTLKESVWFKLLNSEKNILVHLKNNPLQCDCSLHWIKKFKSETELHFKDANCENGQSIFSKNFAVCEKAPLLDPFGDVYKKCCHQIQYKNKPGLHETILITEVDHHGGNERDHYDSERIVGKSTISKTQHHDLVQEQDKQFSKTQVVTTNQRIVLPHHHDSVKQINEDHHEIGHLKLTPTQRLVLPQALPHPHSQKILLSPAVLVKKPLKYRRLVTTSNHADQLRHPIHHTMYAESSVPHVQVVKSNGDHF